MANVAALRAFFLTFRIIGYQVMFSTKYANTNSVIKTYQVVENMLTFSNIFLFQILINFAEKLCHYFLKRCWFFSAVLHVHRLHT